MNKKILFLPFLILIFLLNFLLNAEPVREAPGIRLPTSQELNVRPDFGRMPLYFIPNEGQVDSQVDFYVKGKDKIIYFTPKGVTFVLAELNSSNAEAEGRYKVKGSLSRVKQASRRWVVNLDFIGARSDVRPLGKKKTGAVISYFKGKPEDWYTSLPAYSRIVYPNLWPGIDLVYYGTVDRLKYEFIVHPGADPSRIQLAYRGAKSVGVDEKGRLKVDTPLGGFHDDVPAAYQEKRRKRVNISLAYRPQTLEKEAKHDHMDKEQSETQAFIYGFEVGDYDRNLTLVLDPAILVYCGYIGGSKEDWANGIAVDSSGSAYVTGETLSEEGSFPVAVGPDLTYSNFYDAFVAKVNASGSSLDYCGYIGGSWDDWGIHIAVDDSGNAYIAGCTESAASSFPVIVGPDLTSNGDYDAFVAKVNASGTSLDYCGYIGGYDEDWGCGIAVDSSGSAYVSGYTQCDELSGAFPVTVGPDLTYNGGDWDAFVAKVNALGSSLEYCGYIGGSNNDYALGVAVDGSGSAYVSGYTYSTEGTFPVAVGPDLSHNGGRDVFVAKVNASGISLAYCGYIGGSNQDTGWRITADDSGNAYITGYTKSEESTFPVVVGPDLTHNGDYDAFIAKVDSSGMSLVYCGYIGGSNTDYGQGIAVDSSGNAYIAGDTFSNEGTFPVAVGPDLTHNGGSDAFVVKVDSSGTSLVYCGYIGGSNEDCGHGIALDSSGDAYITGITKSSQSSFPVVVGPDVVYTGGTDVYVAKVSHKAVLPDTPSNPSPSDGATGVMLYTDLDWDDCSWATSYDVYFGKSSPPPYVGNVTESSYNPVVLDPGTDYYWKVAAKNELGETSGAEWSFITCTFPETPSNLSPANGASDVSLDVDLDWEESSGASSYDVYFGTTSPPSYLTSVTESYCDPGPLVACSTYYWRIEARNDCGMKPGEEWSFTTLFALPEAFANLSPSNGAINIPIDSVLNWEDSNNATSYDVYFGADSPPSYVTTVMDSYYDPGLLDPNTTYHWRVVAKSGCGEIAGEEWSFTTGKKPWTFMVYLDGDNNLEGAGIDDFREMASVGSTKTVNIIVQFDRISGEDDSYGDWTTSKRFYITSGMTPTPENALEDLGELNHGDPQTLIDFINWAKANYPADRYALILWNHGGGWRESKEKELQAKLEGKKRPYYRAVCWDDTDGEDTLYMDEVQDALDVTGSNHLIGFDACLMGMVEVAYEIMDYGEVMVGSEETEPGDGWPYDLILQDLVNNPSWSSSELGQAVVSRYYESYGDNGTQSVIDLSKMDTLASAISSFAQALMDNWNTDKSAVKDAASEVMIQIENAVIHEQHGPGWPGANGLAVYFPSTSGEFNPDYESVIDFTSDTQWEEFLQEFYNSMAGSWIFQRRAITQRFYSREHVDLYHFCELLNTETEDYYTLSQISPEYLGGGTAWDFQADEASRTYTLPFDFPYFGETIPAGTTIYVCTNGYVDFNDFYIEHSNSSVKLANNKRIAPCWVDLITNGSAQSGEDVYITENVDSVVIRWKAQTYYLAVPVNVELILYADGRIKFNYDGGNDLSATPYRPTIGISKGDGINCYFAVHNSQKALTDVDSVLFAPLSTEPPAMPQNPSPVHEATNVSVEVNLNWDDCVGATSYDVYFGTNSPPSFAATVISSSYYDPGTLGEVTTYYWKIVAKNDYGETPGDVWQFTTCNMPGAFSNLTPSNGASDVSLDVDLDWEDSAGATSYDVYLGTSSPPFYVNTVTESFYDPGPLGGCSTYYWKIVAKNDCGEAQGEEWSFSTITILPQSFSNLSPSNGATEVPLDVDLDWEDSVGAASYDVYLGTASPPPYVTTVMESYYDPGLLDPSTTYHWIVMAKNNCGNFYGEEWSFTTGEKPWTFMVYLDGDNNLEGAGINDFLEMASVGSTDTVNIVVQFDRISGEDNSYGDWTTTKRFYVTSGMTPFPENALEDLGELNHGDPQTLIDFVSWAKENYPAENYALILWNHGGGWRLAIENLWKKKDEKKTETIFKEVCVDDTDGSDSLYMDEVQSALSSSGGVDLIGFDACLMGMVEVAYEIRNNGEAMVGSEELEPGDGWPYDKILQDLTLNPAWSPSELGTAIVDRYYESYGSNHTQSAVDLSIMNTLASTISSFAQEMIDSWDSDQDAVKNAAQAVMTELDNTVIHEQHGSSWPGAHGLAVYFPEMSGEFSLDYNGNIIDFPNDTKWEEFLQEYYTSMGGSWIEQKRSAAQEFDYPEHIDLYHFCALINAEDYYAESQISHEYIGDGTAQSFQEDDDSITYTLPFNFLYFDEIIPAGAEIYICTNGFIDFAVSSGDWSDTVSELISNKRIAPYWTDLTTDGSAQAGEDIYITESSDNLVIRWVAETVWSEKPVNIELVLYNDGRIQFNYDGGNTDLGVGESPTIGISRGNSVNHHLSVYNGENALTNVDSDLFTPIDNSPSVSITSLSDGDAVSGTINIEASASDDNEVVKVEFFIDDVLKSTDTTSPYTYSWDTTTYSNGAHKVKAIAYDNIGKTDSYEISATVMNLILTIQAGAGGTTSPSPGSYVYAFGAEVSITASPDTGCRCAGWTGDVPSGHENDNPVAITMDSDKTITANFIRQYTLTIVAGTGGTTDPAPGSHPCDSGTQVSVTASVTSTGYQFSGWSGAATGTTNPVTITMDADKTLTANFTPPQPPDEGGEAPSAKKGGCFIATAAYGSPIHPHLDTLRDFRDKYLMPNGFGRKFVELYYRYSPAIADFIARHKILKVAVRINLLPVIAFSSLMLHFGPVATAVVLVIMLVFPFLFIRFYPGRARVL